MIASTMLPTVVLSFGDERQHVKGKIREHINL
jgi:hypothetical protein